MPRGPGGTYTPPPGTTAVPNATIASAPYNAVVADIGDALTESLPRTGVAPMLNDLPMGSHKITGLDDGTDPGDAVNMGQLDGKLNVDASNVGDATAQAAFRSAVGVDYTVQSVNVSALSSGILEIPANGSRFVLEGHGSADFTIEGFGNLRPAGKAFSLLVPRTIGDTGGTAYALGNKVSFVHTTSGAGLDLTMNMRMIDGSASFTYEAYPNACDSEGHAAALYEELLFVPLGDGRHELVRLPDDVSGRNAKGWWKRSANGWQTIGLQDQEVRAASGLVLTLVALPASFNSLPLPPRGTSGYNAFYNMTTYSSTDNTGYYGMSSVVDNYSQTQAAAVIVRSNSTNTIFILTGEGFWK